MSQSSPPREPEGDTMSPSTDENMDYRDAYQNGSPMFDIKEQDRWLPIANVARIMKTALPDNAKIAKEAKECMQECVSEFISFITSEASEKCQQEKRKTVNGEDILFAMTSLGFENYAEALKIYLSKYRETQSSRTEGQTQGTTTHQPTGSLDDYAAEFDTSIPPRSIDLGAPGSSNAAEMILQPPDPTLYGNPPGNGY